MVVLPVAACLVPSAGCGFPFGLRGYDAADSNAQSVLAVKDGTLAIVR